MPRLFAAASDEGIGFAAGNMPAFTSGTLSIAVLMRRGTRTNTAEDETLFCMNGGEKLAFSWGSSVDIDRLQFANGSTGQNRHCGAGCAVTSSDGWAIVGVSTNGGSNPRFHRYVFGTNTWTHVAGNSTQAQLWPTSVYTSTIANGTYTGVLAGPFNGDIAAVALWVGTQLTDAQHEYLSGSLDAWTSLAPTALWVLDQDSTSQTVLEWMGTKADEATLTGSAVSTSSAPLGYGANVIVPGVSAGAASVEGAAALSGQGTVAASAHVTRNAAAALSGQGTLVAAGTLGVVEGAADLAGTGTLAAAAHVTRNGAAGLTAQGTLAAAASTAARAAADLAGTGTLAAAAHVTRNAAAALAGQGTLAAAAKLAARAAAALTAQGTLSATASTGAVEGAAAISGTGTLAAAAKLGVNAAADLSGQCALAAAATVTRNGVAALAGTGTVSASAHLTRNGTAALSGVGTVAADGRAVLRASAALSGVATLVAAAETTSASAVSVSARRVGRRSHTATTTAVRHRTRTTAVRRPGPYH